MPMHSHAVRLLPLFTLAATLAAEEPVLLESMIVEGRAESLIGIAGSASEGVVGGEQLALRPLLRTGEIVEAVPGVIVSQHSGAGKANQFYLRGFNLDHGTDLLTTLEGVPVNMRSHAHGQGYTDLNFLIPEFIREVQYKKGPYYAEIGDFGSAGAFDIRLFDTLPGNFFSTAVGSDGYARLVFGQSFRAGPGTLLYGGEVYHHDGPWENPDDFQRLNGLLRYSQGNDENGWSATAMAYHGDWTATDQIAQRALGRGFPRFGSLDETTGGDSSRYSLQAEWHRSDDQSASRVMLYGMYYDLDLFSNFTYFLANPERGDQFEQKDRRIHWGGAASHTLLQELFSRPMEHIVGLQFRQDHIRNGLFSTEQRNRYATTRTDRILETSAGLYYTNRTKWSEWFRTEAGVRADYYRFDVESDLGVSSGNAADLLASPKLSLIFGPWKQTELYLNGGFGFHSNDARGVITRIDPAEGVAVTPADPLVRTQGAEIGVRTTVLPGMQSSLALWMLEIDSELLFVGDAGTTEASRPSRRWGVEFANYYTPTPWLMLDADFAFSQARFRDRAPEGDRIPGSIEAVIAAGITVKDVLGGLWASARVRHFGPRDLVEDGSVRSSSTTLVNTEIGYQFNETWSASVQVLNLFDAGHSDIDYFYPSRLRGEPKGPADGGYNDRHLHPVEPRQVRFTVTAKF